MKQTDDATPKRREETERPDEVFQLLAFQRDELREGGSEGKREKSYKIRSSQRLGGRGRSVRAADGRSTWHTHGVDNTVNVSRMSHRKWRESKQQLTSWPDLALPGCCLVCLHILCDILLTFTVYIRIHACIATLSSDLRPTRAPCPFMPRGNE